MIDRLIAFILLISTATLAPAESVVAARPIRAGTILSANDLTISDIENRSTIENIEDSIGMQVTRNLFPGQPISHENLREPHLISRNQKVKIHFNNQNLTITSMGRALDGGAIGDHIRVLNSSSRKTVVGEILEDGSIAVAKN